MNENQLAKVVMDCALSVHKDYGPGIFESVYEKVIVARLRSIGIGVKRQVPIHLPEKGIEHEIAFKIDLLVEGKLIVELKSVEKLTNVHRKQLLTYLRLTKLKLGLLINFDTDLVLRNGCERVVNGL